MILEMDGVLVSQLKKLTLKKLRKFAESLMGFAGTAGWLTVLFGMVRF